MSTLELLPLTDAIRAMPEGKSLLRCEKGQLDPVYAEKINKVLVLGEWATWRGSDDRLIGIFAAIMPHGAVHVCEVFFAAGSESDPWQELLGTMGAWVLKYPCGYDEAYDEEVGEQLAARLGLATLERKYHA